MRRIGIPALTLFAVSLVPVQATILSYASGFESPTYTLGPLSGQDGWSIYHPTASSTNVENTVVSSGSQAVGVFSGQESTGQSGPFHADSMTGPLVFLSADIFLASSSSQTRWQFAGTGDGLTQYLGGIDVLPDSSMVLVTQGFPLAGVFTRDTWHHVAFAFDMTAQTYDFSLDGQLVASGVQFCRDDGPCTSSTPIPNFGIGIFDVFADPGINDAGYLDNYQVTAVPEPSSLLLVGLGFALIAKRQLALRTKG